MFHSKAVWSALALFVSHKTGVHRQRAQFRSLQVALVYLPVLADLCIVITIAIFPVTCLHAPGGRYDVTRTLRPWLPAKIADVILFIVVDPEI